MLKAETPGREAKAPPLPGLDLGPLEGPTPAGSPAACCRPAPEGQALLATD